MEAYCGQIHGDVRYGQKDKRCMRLVNQLEHPDGSKRISDVTAFSAAQHRNEKRSP